VIKGVSPLVSGVHYLPTVLANVFVSIAGGVLGTENLQSLTYFFGCCKAAGILS
jgi:hypothetical protein